MFTNQIPAHNTKQKVHKLQPRIINLSDVRFTKEQIQTLFWGPYYAIEKEPKRYINELILDTENAIRQLDPKLQNVYRHLASKQIKHKMDTSCLILN